MSGHTSILIIDDEEILLKALDRFFKKRGFDVAATTRWQEGLQWVKQKNFDALLVDLMLPGMSGLDVLRQALELQPHLAAVVMTGYGTIPSAVEAVRAGAYQYMTKPFDLENMESVLEKAIQQSRLKEENRLLRAHLQETAGSGEMVGQSLLMQDVASLVGKVAVTDSTILITGESGTGKELLAKSIHARSQRSSQPFIAVNCAAIPEGLLESELFGHVRGAFTDAVANRPGKFELANRGTIFLDEIGDMSPKLQVKVLRILQERTFEPVGSSKTQAVDIRVIAATHQNLEEAVKNKSFREDLFYRLNVIPIHLPALRDRREDIPALAGHFLKKHGVRKGKEVTGISSDAMELLIRYPWPGNIRELENIIERLVVFKEKGEITPGDLPEEFQDGRSRSGKSFKDQVRDFEMRLIRKALQVSGGNKNRAAELLRIKRTTLIEKMKKIGAPNR